MGIVGSFWPLLAVAGFLSATWWASKLSRLFGVSSIVLEIAVGIALGPQGAGLVSRDYTVCELQRQCKPPPDWSARLDHGLSLGSHLDAAVGGSCDPVAFGILLPNDDAVMPGNLSNHSNHSHYTNHTTATTTAKVNLPIQPATTTRGPRSGTTTAPRYGLTTIPYEVNETTTTDTTTTRSPDLVSTTRILGGASRVNATGNLSGNLSGHRSGISSSNSSQSEEEDNSSTTASAGRQLGGQGGPSRLQREAFEECLLQVCEDDVRRECSSEPDIFTLIGRAGVALMIFESGMHFDFTRVQEVGVLTCLPGLVGTILPLVLGSVLAVAFGKEFVPHGLAAGTALMPSSVSFAIRMLGDFGVVQEPAGQAIIAAAFFDEIVALVMFTILANLGGDIVGTVVFPIIGIVFMTLALLAGALVWQKLITKVVMPFVPMARDPRPGLCARIRLTRDEVLFLLMMVVLVAYGILTQLLGTHLWGCFVAGATFARLEMPGHPRHALHVWVRQSKRLTAWMVRIFFACTVAFAIPLGEFFTGNAFWKGTVLSIVACILAKACCALWLESGALVGCAMVSRGEFAFLIAEMAFASKMLDEELFSIVIWALLYTAILAPLAFRILLRRDVHERGDLAHHRTGEESDEMVFQNGGLESCEEEHLPPPQLKAPHRSQTYLVEVEESPCMDSCMKDLEEVKLEDMNPEQECLTENCREIAEAPKLLEDGVDPMPVATTKVPSEKKSRKKAGKGTKNVKHAIFPGASPINTRGFLCCLFFRKIIVD